MTLLLLSLQTLISLSSISLSFFLSFHGSMLQSLFSHLSTLFPFFLIISAAVILKNIVILLSPSFSLTLLLFSLSFHFM